MAYYFLLLSKHKNLSLKRKSDYKRNLIISVVLIAFLMITLMSFLVTFPKEDFEHFLPFVLPAIIILDFSIRFFFKKNATMAILPYLILPIPRKTLILYLILSDLLHFWILGCGLIYSVILYYYGVLMFGNVIILLVFILLNNYFATLIKTLIGGYTILIYPICLGFVLFILLIVSLLNPTFAIPIVVSVVFSLAVILFFTLKENLYKELNCIAL